jgi:hypothetical protein
VSRRRHTALIAVLGLTMAAGAATAAPAATPLGRATGLSGVAAYDGHAVWTQRSHGRQVLVERFAGRTRTIPGSSQAASNNRVPAAVAPGPTGAVTTAFAVCRASGCGVYIHRYGAKTSELIRRTARGHGIAAVALWRDQLVLSTGGSGTYRVYRQNLRTHRLRRIDLGTTKTSSHADFLGAKDLALRGERLLGSWVGPTCSTDPVAVSSSELWIARLGHQARRTSTACPGEGGLADIKSVSLGNTGGRVLYGTSTTCIAVLSAATGQVKSATPVPSSISAVAQDGNTYVYIRSSRVFRASALPGSSDNPAACTLSGR